MHWLRHCCQYPMGYRLCALCTPILIIVQKYLRQRYISAHFSAFVECYVRILPEIGTSTSMVSSSGRCAKCGTFKNSGKRSCCARGGTWFTKCGDSDGTKLDHTWIEGIQACNTSASAPLALQVILHHGETMQNLDDLRNIYRKRTHINLPGGLSNVGTTYSKDYFELTKIIVCMCVLFIFLCL